jgi:chloramphenicol 3-O-phosphotransferase
MRIQFEVKRKVQLMKKELTTDRTWLHIDMDMFFAAVSDSQIFYPYRSRSATTQPS